MILMTEAVSFNQCTALFFREQSVRSPRVSEHRSPLDETGNLLQQTETHQQQRNQQQHFTGEPSTRKLLKQLRNFQVICVSVV